MATDRQLFELPSDLAGLAEPDLERTQLRYQQFVREEIRTGRLTPEDLKQIEASALQAAAETLIRSARPHSKPNTPAHNIITPEELIESVADGVFLHENFFLVEDGSKKFDKITKSLYYYLWERNKVLAMHNPPRLGNGKRWVVFGGGTLRFESLLAQQLGLREDQIDLHNIELAKESHSYAKRNVSQRIGRNALLANHGEDFLNFELSGMWHNGFIETKIRRPGEFTPIHFGVFNCINNARPQVQMNFLSNLRHHAQRGDTLDITYDFTRNREAILRAYGLGLYSKRTKAPDFKGWFEPGFYFLCTRKLGLIGLEKDKIHYNGRIVEDPLDILNFQGRIEIEKSHKPPKISWKLQKILDGMPKDKSEPFYEKIAHWGGSDYEVVSSLRPPETLPPAMHHICGWQPESVTTESDLPPEARSPLGGINPVLFRLTPIM